MHPGGIQFFEEFWVSIFGTKEWVLRFPFVIMGLLSIFLTYKVGTKFFDKKTGVFASTLLTITYFPIIHSELARPYSPGLFFILLSTWFWFNFFFNNESQNNKNKWINAICLGITFSITMYIHYFAFMLVLFMGLSGLFFVKKRTIIPYLTSGLISLLLFFPHIEITYYHLSIENGLQWLSRPEINWLFKFIFYCINESYILLSTIIFLIILGRLKRNEKTKKSVKKTLIICFWFFGIYIIAFIFSYLKSPILKFPVMLFPLPFLFILIGRFFERTPNIIFNLSFIILIIVGSSSTIFEKKLFGNRHFGVFRELTQPIIEWQSKYGKENTHLFMNLNNPNYLNFYIQEPNEKLLFDKHLIGFKDHISIREQLINSNKDYCLIGYSSRLTLPQIYETCKEFYPVILDYKKLNNCAVFLLSKYGKSKKTNKQIIAEFHPKKQNDDWIYKKNQLTENFYLSDSSNIYGPNIIFQSKNLNCKFEYYIRTYIEAESNIKNELTVNITATRNGLPVKDINGKNIWIGCDLENMINYPKLNEKSYFSFSLPKEIRPKDDIQISFWNRNGCPVKIKYIKIEAIENIWN